MFPVECPVACSAVRLVGTRELDPQPEFEDEDPINPFDFWAGANFKLKIKKVAGYWNYDSSEFDRQSALLECRSEPTEHPRAIGT